MFVVVLTTLSTATGHRDSGHAGAPRLPGTAGGAPDTGTVADPPAQAADAVPAARSPASTGHVTATGPASGTVLDTGTQRSADIRLALA